MIVACAALMFPFAMMGAVVAQDAHAAPRAEAHTMMVKRAERVLGITRHEANGIRVCRGITERRMRVACIALATRPPYTATNPDGSKRYEPWGYRAANECRAEWWDNEPILYRCFKRSI